MDKRHILFFDGECIFCDSWIRIFYGFDYRNRFTFCALQAEYAKSLLPTELIEDLHTIAYLEGEKLHLKSTAIIKALANAFPLFYILYPLLLVPSGVRDRIYNWVAINRYKFFGRKDLCVVDPKIDKKRFIVK